MNPFPYTDEQLRQMFEVVFSIVSSCVLEFEDRGYLSKIVREAAMEDGMRCCMSVYVSKGRENTAFIHAYIEKIGLGSVNFEVEEVVGIDVLAMAKLIKSFGKKGGAQ